MNIKKVLRNIANNETCKVLKDEYGIEFPSNIDVISEKITKVK